jgi:hypothetical protein
MICPVSTDVAQYQKPEVHGSIPKWHLTHGRQRASIPELELPIVMSLVFGMRTDDAGGCRAAGLQCY